MSGHEGCGCCAAETFSATRRRVVRLAVAGAAVPHLALATAATPLAGPAVGDTLVEDDVEGAPKMLTPADLPLRKPLLAYPFDAKAKAPRDTSRLNKLLLMRFDEAELDAPTRARAAGGVLAYSAICTHQACDVKTWIAKEQVLVCFCHASKFKLLEGGAVAVGPATRALPSLPLKLDGGQIVVAGPFSSTPGGHTG